MGGSEGNWESQGGMMREGDKEQGEKDDALVESWEGFSIWGGEKYGDDEQFGVIENINWKIINIRRNMRRKTKEWLFVPAVETDEGRRAHWGALLSSTTADEQIWHVLSQSNNSLHFQVLQE